MKKRKIRKKGEFFSGFRAKFQKIVTRVAFSIKFAKTNQKFAENSEFCEKNPLLFKIIIGSRVGSRVGSGWHAWRVRRVNMGLKALAEIYTMHSFAQL